ncbi:MAG: hypothetical protein FWE23_01705 [Chitinivibrionia bacterium]|nr:hypothetical protein [Chitinivibrionia bacterium]
MKQKIVFLVVFAVAAQIFAQSFMGSFTENFNNAGLPTNFQFDMSAASNRNVWENGVFSETEPQTRVMRLDMHPDNAAGAWQGPNFNTPRLTLFGRYSTRVRIPCVQDQPNVGGVVGFFTYYSDEWSSGQAPDWNQNGLFDNSEIDIEWLVAHPQLVYLTAWTDFQDGENFRKIGRIVNMATGEILSTTFGTSFASAGIPLTGVENYPETIRAIPNFDASQNFYTYGFDWKTDNIRWWMLNPADESDTIVMWDYREPHGRTLQDSRITQKPASFMFNFWHTNDWAAEGKPNSTEAPSRTFSAEFDWIKYETLNDIPSSKTPQNLNNSPRANKTFNATIRNRQLNLSLPTTAQTATISIFDLRGRLLFERAVKVNENSASIAFPRSIAKNQTAILQVKTNDFNLSKRVLIK